MLPWFSNTSIFSLFFSIKATIIALFFLLISISPSYCLYHHKHKSQDSTKVNSIFGSNLTPWNQLSYTHAGKGLLEERKTRLGSTPPSCYNKCNQCHPCMAVQVPTTPSHHRVERSRVKDMPMEYFDSSSPSIGANRYSNYKPLGWKCRCDNHFYNP